MSRARAEACAYDFRATKRALLRDVALEKKTKRQVVSILEKRYERLTKTYLRGDGTTYAAWLEHGPRAELLEVQTAAQDDAVWDRLVDKHAARSA